MKINEVEALVGITKKNIRFYEDQGLLSPRRNSDNGYRDYGEAEVAVLKQIKLMRKLGLPLEEIRKMQAGTITVADGMRRHLVELGREKQNVEQSMLLCRRLSDRECRLENLDASVFLEEMARMEEGGTAFQDKQSGDMKPRRYFGAVAVTLVFSALTVGVISLLLWAAHTDPQEAPPWPLLCFIIGCFAAVIPVLWLALRQRIHEIRKGEVDDAKKY